MCHILIIHSIIVETFSFTAELAHIRFTQDRANENSRLAQRLHRATFPQRRFPAKGTFAGIHQHLREIGSFKIRATDRGVQRNVRTLNMEEEVLDNWMTNNFCNSGGLRFWTNVYGDFFHPYDEPDKITDFGQLFQDHLYEQLQQSSATMYSRLYDDVIMTFSYYHQQEWQKLDVTM